MRPRATTKTVMAAVAPDWIAEFINGRNVPAR